MSSKSEYIVIVQCTGKKRDGVHTAATLYEPSVYFRKQRDYAVAVSDAWYVQSAKHGLLTPKDTVQSYDKRAKEIESPTAWANDIATDLNGRHQTESTVSILGGASYADPLTPELERLGFDVIEPLRGQMIGERMASLDEMMNERLTGYHE